MGALDHDVNVHARVAPRSRERGFSLVEFVVAFAVITIGLLGLIATMSSAIVTNDASNETRIAASAIANEIESLQTQLDALTTTAVAAFVGQTGWTLPAGAAGVNGLPNLVSGTAAVATISFLTEAQAQAYWQSSVGVDLNENGIPNETTPPSTTTPQRMYALKLSVIWGDRTDASQNRNLDVYTILFARD